MADPKEQIFCENPEKNQFSAKIVSQSFRMKIRHWNFRRKFVSATAVMEPPHA
jgi:hypothetical protein